MSYDIRRWRFIRRKSFRISQVIHDERKNDLNAIADDEFAGATCKFISKAYPEYELISTSIAIVPATN